MIAYIDNPKECTQKRKKILEVNNEISKVSTEKLIVFLYNRNVQ